jgi:hypothetical protein
MHKFITSTIAVASVLAAKVVRRTVGKSRSGLGRQLRRPPIIKSGIMGRSPFFAFLLTGGALLGSSAAEAQYGQYQTSGEIRGVMYNACMSNGYGPAFCGCWVNAAWSLLTPEAIRILLSGGSVPWIDDQANRACAPSLPRR